MAASQDREATAGAGIDPGAIGGAAWPVARHLALILAMFALAWLSISILGPNRVAPIWPANGVLLAVLLRTDRRSWPLWLADGFIGISAGVVVSGGAVLTTVGLALWSLVEVALSAMAIRMVGGARPDFSRLRVVAVGGLAAMASSALGAWGGHVFLGWFSRPDAIHSVAVWTLAGGLGQMIGAPVMLALAPLRLPPSVAARSRVWTVASLMALVAVVVAVFTQSRHDLLFLVFAPLLVVVFRLETLGAALGVLLTSILAVGLTVSGHGPLIRIEAAMTDRVLLLQLFLLSCVVVNFPVAAALADRRRAQDEVRASEERLKFFGDFSRDVVLRLSLDRRILDVSANCRQYGYTPEELIGRHGADLNHSDDRNAVASMFDDVSAGAGRDVSRTREWRVRGGDGAWIPIEGHVIVVRGLQGEPTEFVLVIRDLKERKAAADAVARSEARYRLLAENSGDLVLQFDSRANILYASAAARKFGYRPEDLVGRNCFSLVHPDDVDRAKQAMAAAVNPSRGEAPTREWRVITAQGKYVWVEGNPAVSRDAEGRVVSYTDSVRDISRRKALEEDLRRKRAEAEASEAARRAAEAAASEHLEELARVSRALSVGEFATSIAHELNQPIAAIVTNGDASLRWLARDPPDLDEARAAIERAIRDANRAAAVITRTRAMLTKGPAVLVAMDINACIEEVLLFTEADLRRNKVVVRKTLAASLPAVSGDRIQLQQVLLNLIRNAIEAMCDSPGAARELSLASGLNEGGEVVVSVADNGDGLDPQSAQQLFDSFFTTKVEGVGLGLPISRSIVEAHGGRLWAEPREGGGATFKFTLRPVGTSR